MSKTVLLFQFLLVIVIVSAPLYAQIPNNGFEQWDQSEPTDWVTSNLWWLKTVSKTENSHSGLSALKLQTADFTDEKEVKVLLSSLRHDLDLLHEHAVNEDNIIFPEISDEEPQMIEVLNEEH